MSPCQWTPPQAVLLCEPRRLLQTFWWECGTLRWCWVQLWRHGLEVTSSRKPSGVHSFPSYPICFTKLLKVREATTPGPEGTSPTGETRRQGEGALRRAWRLRLLELLCIFQKQEGCLSLFKQFPTLPEYSSDPGETWRPPIPPSEPSEHGITGKGLSQGQVPWDTRDRGGPAWLLQILPPRCTTKPGHQQPAGMLTGEWL